jgi:hypothetical protein
MKAMGDAQQPYTCKFMFVRCLNGFMDHRSICRIVYGEFGKDDKIFK